MNRRSHMETAEVDAELLMPSTSVEYRLSLGESLLSREPKLAYCTLRYDFKPSSVNATEPGTFKINQSSRKVLLTIPNSNGGITGYQGKFEPNKDDFDCVAIFDGEQFRLEILGGQVMGLKQTRDTDDVELEVPSAPARSNTAASSSPATSPAVRSSTASPSPSKRQHVDSVALEPAAAAAAEADDDLNLDLEEELDAALMNDAAEDDTAADATAAQPPAVHAVSPAPSKPPAQKRKAPKDPSAQQAAVAAKRANVGAAARATLSHMMDSVSRPGSKAGNMRARAQQATTPPPAKPSNTPPPQPLATIPPVEKRTPTPPPVQPSVTPPQSKPTLPAAAAAPLVPKPAPAPANPPATGPARPDPISRPSQPQSAPTPASKISPPKPTPAAPLQPAAHDNSSTDSDAAPASGSGSRGAAPKADARAKTPPVLPVKPLTDLERDFMGGHGNQSSDSESDDDDDVHKCSEDESDGVGVEYI